MPRYPSSLIVLLLFAVFPLVISSFVSTSAYSTGPALQSVSLSILSSSSDSIQPASLIVTDFSKLTPTCSPSAICPALLDRAYGFDKLLGSGVNGSGQTVVIDDACGDPNIVSDLSAFDSFFHLNDPTLNIFYPQGKKNLCVDGGWSIETSLDVEWAHVVAPGARIDLLVANQPSPADMYGAWNYSLKHNLGYQISNSYGGAGCGNRKCNNTIGQGIGPCTTITHVDIDQILADAAAQHVTVLAAAGDSGAWGEGRQLVQPIPGDCEGVLTVGGTTLSIDSSGNYLGEVAWSATGGGYTTLKEPKYQVKANITDPFGTLAKPDVAADADPRSGVWFYNGGWGVVGGTSLSCPLWAGFMADVNQIRTINGLLPAGFVNPFLYGKVYSTNGSSIDYSRDFHDIKSGNNGWPSGIGWDADTGLGSFIVPHLEKTLGTNPKA